MHFTFLGTSAGMPSRERNVTALALATEQARHWYLVDCGEATQHQLLRTAYSAVRLRAIFITHVHGDHCYGLPGLIASAQMGGQRSEPLTICAPAGVAEFVDAAFRHTALEPLYPIHFVRSDTPDFRYQDEAVTVTSIALSHRVPSYGYRVVERVRERRLDPARLDAEGVPRGPLWGELQRGETVTLADGRTIAPAQVCEPQRAPRCVVVGGDNDDPGLLRPALRDCNLLIHEATYSETVLARIGPQYQHSTPAQVARVAAEMALPNLCLTHFSQRFRRRPRPGEAGIAELEAEARQHYAGNLVMAADFDSYELRRDGRLVRLQAGRPKTKQAR